MIPPKEYDHTGHTKIIAQSNISPQNSNIKSCPWCGELPTIWNHKGKWAIDCQTEDCINPGTPLLDKEEFAINRWNARPSANHTLDRKKLGEIIYYAMRGNRYEPFDKCKGTDVEHYCYILADAVIEEFEKGGLSK